MLYNDGAGACTRTQLTTCGRRISRLPPHTRGRSLCLTQLLSSSLVQRADVSSLAISFCATRRRLICEVYTLNMATDPYHAVQQEVQSSLQAAETLRASYLRIRSTARDDSEELSWARSEVKKNDNCYIRILFMSCL
jgi:hypothetical protein